MKLSDAKTYFTQVVIPTCDEFQGSPTDAGLAANAVVSLNHVLDWVSKESNIAFDTFKRDVETKCQAIKALRELANGIKHPGSKWPELAAGITFAESTFTFRQAQFTYGQAKEALSIPKVSTEPVRVVSELILEVRAFWTNFFAQRG